MELNGLHCMLWGNHILFHKILYYRWCINICALRNMCTKSPSRGENWKCLPISTVCRGNRIQTRNCRPISPGLRHSPRPCRWQWLIAYGLSFQCASDSLISLQTGSHHGVSFHPIPRNEGSLLFSRGWDLKRQMPIPVSATFIKIFKSVLLPIIGIWDFYVYLFIYQLAKKKSPNRKTQSNLISHPDCNQSNQPTRPRTR